MKLYIEKWKSEQENMPKHKTNIYTVQLLEEREKAINIEHNDFEYWIPKSACKIIEE